jgi:hypothetical protein
MGPDYFKKELDHLLYDGDDLCVQGITIERIYPALNKFFRVYLLHEATESNDYLSSIRFKPIMNESDYAGKIGSIWINSLFHFYSHFQFTVGTIVLMIHRSSDDIEIIGVLPERGGRLKDPSTTLQYVLNPSQHFIFKIEVIGNGYRVYYNDSLKNQTYEDPLLPPWAAEWLTV